MHNPSLKKHQKEIAILILLLLSLFPLGSVSVKDNRPPLFKIRFIIFVRRALLQLVKNSEIQ